MPDDDQIGFEFTGKKRNMVQRVANREMGHGDDATRREFLDAITEDFPRGLLQCVERHSRRNIGTLRPRQGIQNGKQVRFRPELLR